MLWGYDPDRPHAELLRYKGLTSGREVPIPEEFYSDVFLDYSYKKYVEMYSIQHWLFEFTRDLGGTLVIDRAANSPLCKI